MRTTAASSWAAAGLSIAEIAEMVGDTEETVLARYIRPAGERRGRAVVNAFGTSRDDTAATTVTHGRR
jgi:predicted transcriptional regulator